MGEEQEDLQFTRPEYWKYIDRLQRTKATKTILDWLEMKEGESLLDVGSREGRFLSLLGDRGIFYVGVEVSPAACFVANIRHPGSVVRATAEFLPFREAAFDKVLMCHSVEHLERPEKAMNENHRVMKDEGLLVLSYPNRNYLPYLLKLMKQDAPHKQAFDSFKKWPGFRQTKKRIFLSLPILEDSDLTSQIPFFRETFYNVVLLLRKEFACPYCGKNVELSKGIDGTIRMNRHRQTRFFDCPRSGLRFE